MRVLTIILILSITFTAITHIIFVYYEKEYLIFIKQVKLKEINRAKKNILLYNTNLSKIKNDKEFFISIARRKYGLAVENEYYLND